jgi:hypothetical protein
LLKRAIEETTKIEMVRIQNFEELLGSPDQHIKSMKDANEKLLQAENQLVAAEAERKKRGFIISEIFSSLKP